MKSKENFIVSKKRCYKVISSNDTLFNHEKEFSITCDRCEYIDQSVVFYIEGEMVACFHKPLSVEYDSHASCLVNMSADERLEWYIERLSKDKELQE